MYLLHTTNSKWVDSNYQIFKENSHSHLIPPTPHTQRGIWEHRERERDGDRDRKRQLRAHMHTEGH